jgi:hypothetical protein
LRMGIGWAKSADKSPPRAAERRLLPTGEFDAQIGNRLAIAIPGPRHRAIEMHKLLASFALSAVVALGAAAPARSQDRVIGDPPTDYWTYGDVEFDPVCMHWNWQERSWYDVCTRLHHPLAWSRHGRFRPDEVVARTRD